MPKIKVEIEVPDEYCDHYDNICPMYQDNRIASYCVAFRHELEEDREYFYYCKRLPECKQAEVEK